MPVVRPRPGRAALRQRGLPLGVIALEHTADVGIKVHGTTLEQCFARAAAGMFAILFDPAPSGAPRRRVSVEVESAEGIAELMVSWLEELLYRCDCERLAFDRFEVDMVADDRVSGSAIGSPFEAVPSMKGTIVKGVTRHDLEIARRDGGWVARVYFDV